MYTITKFQPPICYISRLEKDHEVKLLHAEYKFLMYPVYNFQPQILYIIGDMIPPSHGSSLSEDSVLNRWPRENCYISGYKGPNEISQDVLDRAQTVLSVVKVSDLEGETVTCGSPYNFATLNNPETRNLGKTLIRPNWRNQFWSKLCCWKEDMLCYHSAKF